MSLPTKAIDRLFDRLAATYGESWTRQWRDVPIADVKSLWAHELGQFDGRLECITWALQNLPERCPNAIEFRNLCRQAPQAAVKLLPEPKADPKLVEAMLGEIQRISHQVAQDKPKSDPKAWARKLLERHKTDPRPHACVEMAKRALRVEYADGL